VDFFFAAALLFSFVPPSPTIYDNKVIDAAPKEEVGGGALVLQNSKLLPLLC